MYMSTIGTTRARAFRIGPLTMVLYHKFKHQILSIAMSKSILRMFSLNITCSFPINKN